MPPHNSGRAGAHAARHYPALLSASVRFTGHFLSFLSSLSLPPLSRSGGALGLAPCARACACRARGGACAGPASGARERRRDSPRCDAACRLLRHPTLHSFPLPSSLLSLPPTTPLPRSLLPSSLSPSLLPCSFPLLCLPPSSPVH
jgi:hypothetical protein